MLVLYYLSKDIYYKIVDIIKIYDNLMFINHDTKINDTISPYNASASPKINIKIKPTNNLYCRALHRIPTSPTFPIEYPAAYINLYITMQLNPHTNPDAICINPNL